MLRRRRAVLPDEGWLRQRCASLEAGLLLSASMRGRISIDVHVYGSDAASLDGSTPFVSCIMPTYNRRSFISNALRWFVRQDLGGLELIIVDDGDEPVGDLLPSDDRIRYFKLDARATIGAKRNYACEKAHGEYIVHWDDDDWYSVSRVARQIAALARSGAEICGTSRLYYLDPLANTAWLYANESTRRWVSGNTLCYRRSFWRRSPFPNVNIAEDTRFLWQASQDAICDMKDDGLAVGVVHEANTGSKTVGPYWQRCPIDAVRQVTGPDFEVFSRTPLVPANSACLQPLISCIMPTRDRRLFVLIALRLFAGQSYENRELIVVDDGEQPVQDLVEGHPWIRYIRLPEVCSIGQKRNIACREARGEIIAHWDDDDWYAPDRLRVQVQPILAGRADITGLEMGRVLQLPECDFWTVTHALHNRMFVGDVHGGTLMFRSSLVSENITYPEISLAEDASMLAEALRCNKRLERVSNDGNLFTYVRHGRNAWKFCAGRFMNRSDWLRTDTPEAFPHERIAEYQAAAKSVSENIRNPDIV